MVEAVMLWNEPNNLSHWDFHLDPDWKIFARMRLPNPFNQYTFISYCNYERTCMVGVARFDRTRVSTR